MSPLTAVFNLWKTHSITGSSQCLPFRNFWRPTFSAIQQFRALLTLSQIQPVLFQQTLTSRGAFLLVIWRNATLSTSTKKIVLNFLAQFWPTPTTGLYLGWFFWSREFPSSALPYCAILSVDQLLTASFDSAFALSSTWDQGPRTWTFLTASTKLSSQTPRKKEKKTAPALPLNTRELNT